MSRMISAAKRSLPWVHGLLAYLVWRFAAIVLSRRLPRESHPGDRACVVQISSLGDVLMVTPLLRALIEALGPGRVDVVGGEYATPLLANFSGLGMIIPMRTPLRWRHPLSLPEFFRLAFKLRTRHYGVILNASPQLQAAWLTFLAAPGRSIGLQLPRRLGPIHLAALGFLYTDEVEAGFDTHMIRQGLALLKPLGIRASSERMRFSPAPADIQRAEAWLSAQGLEGSRTFVVVHPGAKWPPKRWHPDRFGALVNRLQADGSPVVLVGDKDDRPLLDAVAASITPPPHIAAGVLSLEGIGALIQRASLFIGNDSGLMHLACAVGTPVIALFGPTCPEWTGPLGQPHRALVKPIACRPCRLYFTRDRCERGHNYCMDLIEVDEVWAAAQSCLRRAADAQPMTP